MTTPDPFFSMPLQTVQHTVPAPADRVEYIDPAIYPVAADYPSYIHRAALTAYIHDQLNQLDQLDDLKGTESSRSYRLALTALADHFGIILPAALPQPSTEPDPNAST